MNLEQLIGKLKNTPAFMENVTHWETIPAKEAEYAPFPASMQTPEQIPIDRTQNSC